MAINETVLIIEMLFSITLTAFVNIQDNIHDIYLLLFQVMV